MTTRLLFRHRDNHRLHIREVYHVGNGWNSYQYDYPEEIKDWPAELKKQSAYYSHYDWRLEHSEP